MDREARRNLDDGRRFAAGRAVTGEAAVSLARKAIFGGTFDPIHLGHLHLAQSAMDRFSFEKIFFIPAHQNPLKLGAPAAEPQARWRMLELALAEFGNPNFQPLNWEIFGAGPSFTIETAERLTREQGTMTLLMGDEVFQSLPQWRETKRLLELCDFVVVTRLSAQVNFEKVLTESSLKGHNEKGVFLHGKRRLEALNISALPYSGTSLRQEIKNKWESNDLATPPRGIQRSVWRFIKENRIYAVNKC